MKTKKLSKEMRLNKKSIANLNVDMMGNVKGMSGGSCLYTNCCPSVYPTLCYTCVTLCQPDPYPGRGMMRPC